MSEKTLILNAIEIEQKINRIAHQIQENNFEEKKVFVVGIMGRGYQVAQRIVKVLEQVSDLEIELAEISMDKDTPLNSRPQLSMEHDTLADQSVFLVDDVLNSGKTLMYAANFLLHVPIRKLTTIVLVDRRHRRFPIKADFVGLTLSTTLHERISVELNGEGDAVYLK